MGRVKADVAVAPKPRDRLEKRGALSPPKLLRGQRVGGVPVVDVHDKRKAEVVLLALDIAPERAAVLEVTQPGQVEIIPNPRAEL
jgi:hypothetical protein